jgi:hypothetical protein
LPEEGSILQVEALDLQTADPGLRYGLVLKIVPFPASTPSSRPPPDFPAKAVRDCHPGIQNVEKP